MINETLPIGIFRGAEEDILELNLRSINLKLYNLNSEEFYRVIKKFHPGDPDHITSGMEHFFGTDRVIRDEFYACVPIKKDIPFLNNVYENLEAVLLLMFPSNFRFVGTVVLYSPNEKQKYDNVYFNTVGNYNLLPFTEPNECFLTTGNGNIKDINAFIKLFFNRYQQLPYLNIAMESYIESFKHLNSKMSYVNLFMALDSLIDSTSELVHRTSRLLAVVNADTVECGETIYKNFSNFYKLRSGIVHGGAVKRQQDYYLNVQALVSRTIIELIQLNFPTKPIMNSEVIKSGYSDKPKLNKRYKYYHLNTTTEYKILEQVVNY